jgi:hypothetical protein
VLEREAVRDAAAQLASDPATWSDDTVGAVARLLRADVVLAQRGRGNNAKAWVELALKADNVHNP